MDSTGRKYNVAFDYLTLQPALPPICHLWCNHGVCVARTTSVLTSHAWTQCSWSIHAIRLLRRGPYQYTQWSSVCEIPDALMHAGLCLPDARSCYCGQNFNCCFSPRLLCFAPQVFVKRHQHALTYSCWHRCGNVGMCAYWVTSGRGVCLHMCHDWFFFSLFFILFLSFFFCIEV